MSVSRRLRAPRRRLGLPGPACVLLLLHAPPSEPPTPAPSPSPSPSRRPISDSVERVVQRLEEEKEDPCRRAKAEGVPCFPVSTVIRGPQISVRDSLNELLPANGPSPNRPPSTREMAPFRPGLEGQVFPLVTFDPGCVAKSALKKIKGRNDVYYLYRLKDAHGERVAMYERPLDVARFQGAVEFLGRFDNECDALAAYRREQRKTPQQP